MPALTWVELFPYEKYSKTTARLQPNINKSLAIISFFWLNNSNTNILAKKCTQKTTKISARIIKKNTAEIFARKQS